MHWRSTERFSSSVSCLSLNGRSFQGHQDSFIALLVNILHYRNQVLDLVLFLHGNYLHGNCDLPMRCVWLNFHKKQHPAKFVSDLKGSDLNHYTTALTTILQKLIACSIDVFQRNKIKSLLFLFITIK